MSLEHAPSRGRKRTRARAPPEEQWTTATLCRVFDCDRTTIWRMEKDGRLPPPIVTETGRKKWPAREIRKILRGGKRGTREMPAHLRAALDRRLQQREEGEPIHA
jgi:predicted DNA-binding transcriptional regulator AlpA